jgi:hypothetical protein
MSLRIVIPFVLAAVFVGALVELSCLAGETRSTSAMPHEASHPPGVSSGPPSVPELEWDEVPAAGPTITY